MDTYSSIVYRCPGLHQRPGGTFDYRGVASREEESAAVAAGWFLTLPEAIAGKAAEPAPALDNTGPTRAEMEQKATELQIKFDGRTTDNALAKKIAEALA